MTDNDNLFAAIDGHFGERADLWRSFSLEMIERSSPDIIAAAFAATVIGKRGSRLPDILIEAFRKPAQ